MIKFFSVAILAVLSACTIQAQTVSQNFRLNKGQKLESVSASTMTMNQEMMGQKVNFNSSSTITTLTDVKDVTSQGILFSSTVKRMVTNLSVMGQETAFDSDKKEDMDGQMGTALKDYIGVAKEISVNKQGKVVESQDTVAAASSSNPLSALLGSLTAKGTTFAILAPFPTRSVKVGDTWTDSSGTPETVKMVNTYTLKQVSGNEATIDITGQMAKTGVIEQQGMQLTMNLTGTTTGTSVVDVSTGLLKKNETSMKLGGTMEVMGQSIPITMDNKVTTTVNKVQ